MSTTLVRRQTMATFIRKHRIHMASQRVDSNPNVPPSLHLAHWRVTLFRGSRRMVCVFSLGMSDGEAPSLPEVLSFLAFDADRDGENFEGWCMDHGFPTNSTKVHRLWCNWLRQTAKMKSFFDGAFEELLRHTEPV
jgi:hypothetical protein